MSDATSREEEICFLLKRVANRFNRFQEQGRGTAGVMGAGYMLFILAGRKEINQRELVSMTQTRSASVSETLNKLEKEGLIRRRPDPRDRRNALVSLTAKGQQKEAEITEKRRNMAEELLSPLPEEEQEKLRELLKKLVMGYLSAGPEEDESH